MRYRFGSFELDTDRLVLFDAEGDEIHLEPRVFDVLRFLLENRDRTVTKQQLVDEIWGGAFVSDSALKRAVFEARRALRDHGGGREILRTVHGRGYRFEEPVTEVHGNGQPRESAPPSAAPEHAGPSPSPDRAPSRSQGAERSLARVAGIIGLLAISVLAALLLWRARAPAPGLRSAPEERPFLAVFPLHNLGPVETDAFAEGLTDEIADRLTRLEGLDVLSRASARQYERAGRTLADIHSDLGVTWVLDGSVRWGSGSGDAGRIRVTPQLSSVASDRVLWSHTFDRPVAELLAVQEEIADEVARRLGHVAARSAAAGRPVDPEAYQAYLRAQVHAGFFTERAPLAASLYHRAVELDPGFTRAWAGLAIAEATLFHRGVDRSAEVVGRARQAAKTALELEPAAPEAHRAAGYVHYWIDHDYPAALAAFHRAMELGGGDADSSADEAYVLRRLGRFDEALEKLRRAARLDPLSGARHLVIADTLTYVRRYEEAEAEYERAIALEPDLPLAYALRAQNFLLWRGDLTAAAESLARMPATDEDWAWLYRASLLLATGRPDDLLGLTRGEGDRVLEVEYGTVPIAELEARAHEAAGDRASARSAWERAETALSGMPDERSGDRRVQAAKSLARAALGRCDRAGEALDTGPPFAADAFIAGTQLLVIEAETLLRCGRQRAAIRRLRRLLEIPSRVSPALLAIDPAWIAVRDDPELLAASGEHPSVPAAPPPRT